MWCGNDSHSLAPRKLFHHPHRFLRASACKSASGLHGQSMISIVQAVGLVATSKTTTATSTACKQVAGFVAGNSNMCNTVSITVVKTAYKSRQNSEQTHLYLAVQIIHIRHPHA